MVGNGHERMLAAWERVEAKLDRLAEVQAEHGRTLALLDRRLSRVEGELDLVKLLIESLRVEVDRKLLRLQDELLTALGRETRVELLTAQSLNEDRLQALERRVWPWKRKAEALGACEPDSPLVRRASCPRRVCPADPPPCHRHGERLRAADAKSRGGSG